MLREKGTEAPFTGKYWNEHREGMYRCRACGQELFSSDAKFDSGTGWPSFTDPVNLKNVELKEDRRDAMVRTEVVCKRCGSHLGHVFDDGHRRGKAMGPRGGNPPAGRQGKRYCINSVCLAFEKANKGQ